MLAAKFYGPAAQCQIEFPLASKCLAEIGSSYDRDGVRQDRDAEHSKSDIKRADSCSLFQQYCAAMNGWSDQRS